MGPNLNIFVGRDGALFEAFSLGGNSARVTPEGPQTRLAKLYG